MPTENRSSNTSELLPCPFCGQHDFLIERLDSDASVVICQGLTGPHEACLARGPVGVAQDEGEEQPGHDKAAELWNARAEQHQAAPELTGDLREILGRPNFTCHHIAKALRVMGLTIAHKSEDEQAVVIHWLLGHYLKHGAEWRERAAAELEAASKLLKV
ncbi:Lar family restriction alleviation protein [Pseudomonas hunanensis]|uniref:Lar family restriction alleviation protein n=1 Tax=Pseudomonas hunanensis TaxID=1247546 RepID=UPI00240752F2|nr:Lar family restriction alleviation protein [Pseudomonas hunanensis]MDF9756747.1 hypothetical protein [Pseudomonas hunanensis]